MSERDERLIVGSAEQLVQPATRRKFLRALGVGGTIVLLPSVFTACDDDKNPTSVSPPPPPPASPPPPPATAISLDLRTDVGILSFAYVLEQLEAAFYSAVVGAANFTTLIPDAAEQEILTDIRNHEVIHREFFKAALTGTTIATQTVGINATTVAAALASRNAILTNARRFEDLGVAAYNGAGKYLTNVSNLLVAGKIVSVEARHAAVIRDLLAPASGTTQNTAFAGDDVVDPTTGLDVKLEAGAVLTAVGATNITTSTITITNAPTGAQGAATPDKAPPST